jgi:hypothetical protein
MGLDIAREDVVVAEVVGHAADMAGIADRHRGDAGSVFAVAAGQFLGEVHGVAHGAAVTAGEGLAFVLEARHQQLGGALDVVQGLFVGEKGGQGTLGFFQAVADMFDHAGPQGRSWLA